LEYDGGQAGNVFCSCNSLSFILGKIKVLWISVKYEHVRMSCRKCATNAPNGFILQSAVLHKR
jgi:hypothetical protein